MSDTADVGMPVLGALRSPLSLSTESSDQRSSKETQSGKNSGPLTPHSRLTRKRAASLNTETANLPPRIGDLALNSANSSGPLTPDLTREQVCLCQPDPKIPRPRNGAWPTSLISLLSDWCSGSQASSWFFITATKSL
jgi:hypothetical protein